MLAVTTTATQKLGRGGGKGQGGHGGCECCDGCKDYRNNTSIARSLFEGKLKDGYFHKLTITEGSHRAT